MKSKKEYVISEHDRAVKGAAVGAKNTSPVQDACDGRVSDQAGRARRNLRAQSESARGGAPSAKPEAGEGLEDPWKVKEAGEGGREGAGPRRQGLVRRGEEAVPYGGDCKEVLGALNKRQRICLLF